MANKLAPQNHLKTSILALCCLLLTEVEQTRGQSDLPIPFPHPAYPIGESTPSITWIGVFAEQPRVRPRVAMVVPGQVFRRPMLPAVRNTPFGWKAIRTHSRGKRFLPTPQSKS